MLPGTGSAQVAPDPTVGGLTSRSHIALGRYGLPSEDPLDRLLTRCFERRHEFWNRERLSQNRNDTLPLRERQRFGGRVRRHEDGTRAGMVLTNRVPRINAAE